MFNTISWANYIQAIAVLLLVYYLVVVYVYYRQECLRFFQKRQPVIIDAGTLPVQYLIDEISALISQASYSRLPKQEMLLALQRLVHSDRFKTIHASSFKEAIEKLIVNECQTNCSMHLSEDDLQALWKSGN